MEPEQKLFTRVIIQALEDYVDKSPTGANQEEKDAAKIQATIWLKSNSRDFQDVCDLALINSKWLREKVLNSSKKELKGLINEYYKLIRASSIRNQ